MIEVVWHCISSPTMNILCNDETMYGFYQTKGNSLSSYIFVLYIKHLSNLISLAVDQGFWKPICLNRNGPPLSHLCFAYDLILFEEGSADQAQVIMQCLNRYCTSSEQRVSHEKTRVFFSQNVHNSMRRELSNIMGFSRTTKLGKYLGVLIHHNRVTKQTYRFLLNRAYQRLSGWKAKALSLASHITLIQSVLAALPTYVMQTTSLPKQICGELDKKSVGILFGVPLNIKVKCTWLVGVRCKNLNMKEGQGCASLLCSIWQI